MEKQEGFMYLRFDPSVTLTLSKIVLKILVLGKTRDGSMTVEEASLFQNSHTGTVLKKSDLICVH